ncbi:MAG: hypothetical protein WC694_03690 [Candidatus Paceibacterota bacterium]|jgi:hypothetical protein
MENNLKEPTLEEYGLSAVSYMNYRIQVDDLIHNIDQVDCSLRKDYLNEGDEEKKKEISKKISENIREFGKKGGLIEDAVFPFEKACLKYYKKYLEQFFKNNLYKKNSESNAFRQSLVIFSRMIEEVEEINKKLFLSGASSSYIEKYKTFLGKQSNKKTFFRAFNNIKVKDQHSF